MLRRCLGIWRSEEEAFGCLAVSTRRGPRFLRFARQPLLRRPDGVEEGLGRLVWELGRAPVVLSCSGPDLAVRCLRAPKLSPRDLGSAASWEMELLLGERKGRAVVRHAVLGPSGDGFGVLACAVPEDWLRALVQPLSGRVKLLAVDIEVCALWRLVSFVGAVPGPDGPVAVAAPSGGGAVLVAGSEHLEFAISLPAAAPHDLDRAVSYWESQQRLKVSARLWAGPSPPEGWSPLSVPDVPPEFHLAAGLALHPWLEPRVDLLTREMREGARARRLLPWLLVGVLAASSAGLGQAALHYRTEAGRARREAEVLAPAASKSARLAKDLKEVASWGDLVAAFLGQLPSRARLVDMVARSVPPDAWLTRVDLLPSRDQGQTQGKGPGLPPAGSQLVVEGRSLSLAAPGVVRDALRAALGCEVRVARVVWDDSLGCYSFRVEAVVGGEGE
ncbi:MAG: hypothetical protein AB1503_00715 [Bacillota bacterium]